MRDKTGTPIILSVIVPAYNAESTIERCVRSILANSSISMEVLLINDGSTDRTGQVCDNIALSDRRVRVIHKPNGGVGTARNTGIQEAKGTYLAFVDADDTVAADMYRQMCKLADDNSADCAMCGVVNVFTGHTEQASHAFGNQVIQGNGNIRERVLEPLLVSGHPNEALLACVWNKLYRADKIRKYNLLFSHLPRAEDWLFNIEFFRNADSVVFTPAYLYHYDRTTEGSLSKSWNANNFDNAIKIQARLAELFPERYDEQSLLLGVLNMQVNDLCLYANCFGIRGFTSYAKALFFHERLRSAYREVKNLPKKYRFPGSCLGKERKCLYVLWCFYTAKVGFLKCALRPAYRMLRQLFHG